MRNTNKKGFTIVELVVVVAVIAILAAVLIPTFSGIIAKANIATDKKAVTDINTQLAMVEAEYGKPANLGEATAKLIANGIDIADYKPLSKDYTFYYDADLNKVLYVKDHAKVEFPVAEAEAGIDVSVKDLGRWTSLSGTIKIENYTTSADGKTATIANGAQFAKLAQDYAQSSFSVIEITDDIDLKGANANLGVLNSNLTFNGNNKTIYGLQCNVNAYNLDDSDDDYGYGIFGSVVGAVVEINNLKIDGAVINGDSHSGILVGNIKTGGKVVINGLTLTNSYARSDAAVGALVGVVNNGTTLELTGTINISDTTVTGGREVAKLVGYVVKGATITSGTISTDGITVEHDTTFGYVLDENNSTKDGTRAGVSENDCWLYSVSGKGAGTFTEKSLTNVND